jgi:predicted phosphate transport protein (TIGR00153 family)
MDVTVDCGSKELAMNALEMISGPLLFVEHLHEHTRKVHQMVELIPLLVDAQLATDHQKVKSLHEQMSKIKAEADQIKYSLYDQFADMHFRGAGRYALGQYIASLDKVAESAEAFADMLIICKTTVPTELHADLKALVGQVVQVSGQMLNLAETLWPPEEALSTGPEARDVLDAIERIVEGHRQIRQLGMKFAQHLYGLEGQLDPTALLCLDKCHTALREVTNNTERAANHLRMVIR